MPNIATLYHTALASMQSGDAARAETLLRQVVARAPRHAGALGALGMLCAKSGRHDEAKSCLRRAVSVDPASPANLANLGILLSNTGDHAEALATLERAACLVPGNAQIGLAACGALNALGRHAEALARCEALTRDHPGDAAAWHRQAETLAAMGRTDAAEAAYRQAVTLAPNAVESLHNLGNLHARQRRFDTAHACYRQALAARPDAYPVRRSMGLALMSEGRHAEAEACFREALAANPRYVDGYNSLALALGKQLRHREARLAYEQALAIAPDHVNVLSNLAVHWFIVGDAAAGARCHRRLLAQAGPQPDLVSSYFWDLTYLPGRTPDQDRAERAAWGQALVRSVGTAAPHRNTPDPDRVIRVGYISPDFRDFATANFFEPVLASHDAAQVAVTCYASVARPDHVTARLRERAGAWRDIAGMADRDVAELIRADGIDILVELANHSVGNRLPVLAHRPAPVQVSWLVGLGTTGLPTVDYRFTDPWCDREGAEAFYTESLYRLRHGFSCYGPKDMAPEPAAPPARANGYVTFGCTQFLGKVNDRCVALWSRLLHAVPDARLLLYRNALADEEVRERYRNLFAAHGIGPERVLLEGAALDAAGYLETYAHIDIALDTFPYNGHTTTCEALWQGVPVVTLAPHAAAGRVGHSLLNQVGLADLAAETEGAYLETAAALAADPERRETLRKTLRDRMRRSPLCDGHTFTRELERAYRDVWRHWCAGQARNPSP